MNNLQEVLKQIAEKHNVSSTEVERIMDAQFRVVINTIRKKEDKTILMIHLGKFTPVARRKRYLDGILKETESNS